VYSVVSEHYINEYIRISVVQYSDTYSLIS
jgi:hypothetical protein